MSGHVARSFEKYISFQITHLAFVRRKDFQVKTILVFPGIQDPHTFMYQNIYTTYVNVKIHRPTPFPQYILTFNLKI